MSPASRRGAAALLLPSALLVLAAWLVYGPSLHAGWLWDDTEEVVQNAVLRDPAGWWKVWLAPAGPDYFPLKSAVQWLEWRAWGDAPAGYHAVSIGLHLLSAFLFWRLLGRCGVRRGWIGGLLFVVHPLAVESVAWVAELKNTLSLPLLLLAMLCYLDFDDRRESPPAGAYRLSLLCFLLAMLAKSSVVMFPGVILLHAAWRRGRIDRRDALASVPFFAVALGLGLVTVWFQQHRAIAPGHELAGGAGERLAAAGHALVFYLGKSVWPFGLVPIYPRWAIDPSAPLAYAPWLGLAGLGFCLGRWRRGWSRPVLFGLGFFALNLLPVLGLVAMSYLRMSRVADHFAYLPLLGILGLAAAGLDRLLSRVPAGGPAAAAWLGLAALALVLGWQSRRYARIFDRELVFWSYTVERNPAAWAAQGNLGYALFQQGRAAEAVPHYEAALRLNPAYAEAQYNLGTALLQLNRLPEAVAAYERATRLQPASAEMQNNLGMALVRDGRLAQAAGHFARAVALDPDYAEAHHNLGNALLLTGHWREAIGEYRQVLRLHPDDAAAKSGVEMAERALQHRE
jgi:tetratricopeptide (TPR) repeat protein